MLLIFKTRREIGRAPSGYPPLRLSVLLLCMFAVACQQSVEAPVARYELKGKVVSVDKNRRQVTLDHEEIPGYMNAMVMPFTLNDEYVLKELAPGDQLQATLVVDATSSRLEGISFTRQSPDAVLTNAEVRPEPQVGDVVPAFSLINQDGKPIRLDRYRGKALLLTFIYTRCPLPEYCTLMSNNFAIIDKELQKDAALYEKTHLISISVDPAYDTPKVMRSYGAAHTGNYSKETFMHWEFATGTPEQVKETAQFFGLTYYPEKNEIVHGLRTAIITPEGRLFKIYRGNDWKPEDLLRDLRNLFNKDG